MAFFILLYPSSWCFLPYDLLHFSSAPDGSFLSRLNNLELTALISLWNSLSLLLTIWKKTQPSWNSPPFFVPPSETLSLFLSHTECALISLIPSPVPYLLPLSPWRYTWCTTLFPKAPFYYSLNSIFSASFYFSSISKLCISLPLVPQMLFQHLLWKGIISCLLALLLQTIPAWRAAHCSLLPQSAWYKPVSLY